MGKKVYVDLTHPFSAEIPRWPYFDKPEITNACLLYTSPSPRDSTSSRMPSSA